MKFQSLCTIRSIVMAAADAYSEATLNLKNLHLSNIFVSTMIYNATTKRPAETLHPARPGIQTFSSEIAEKELKVNSESRSHRPPLRHFRAAQRDNDRAASPIHKPADQYGCKHPKIKPESPRVTLAGFSFQIQRAGAQEPNRKTCF